MRQPLLVGRKMGHWVGAETQQQLGGGLLKGGGFRGSCVWLLEERRCGGTG